MRRFVAAVDTDESFMTDTLELSRRLIEVLQRSTLEDDVEQEVHKILTSEHAPLHVFQ